MNTLSLARRRDPFAEFDALVRNAFGSTGWQTQTTLPTGFTPSAEVSRDGEDAVVRLALPGIDAENDVTVEVKDGRLLVHGERRDEHSEDEGGRTLQEFRYGEFRRSFTLPKHVTPAEINASYDAGVLAIRVSGAYTDAEAQRIPVTAGSATPAVESAN